MCARAHLDRPSGSSKTVENASNAAVALWLSELSPDWRLLAALCILSQLSHNHPAAIFFAMKRGHVRTIIAPFALPFAVHVQTTVPWLLLSTVRALYTRGLCSRNYGGPGGRPSRLATVPSPLATVPSRLATVPSPLATVPSRRSPSTMRVFLYFVPLREGSVTTVPLL